MLTLSWVQTEVTEPHQLLVKTSAHLWQHMLTMSHVIFLSFMSEWMLTCSDLYRAQQAFY